MRNGLMFTTLWSIFLAATQPTVAQTAKLDNELIEKTIGAKGKWNDAAGVYKVTFPRTDVPINVDGSKMDPFRGLTSWAAFTHGKQEDAMVMGDMVLFQDEVNPAMSAALNNGLTVTALHNHFFYDDPKVYFMHIGGEGSTKQLATGVRKVLDVVQSVRMKSPMPANRYGSEPASDKSQISIKPLEAILGKARAQNDGMVKFAFGRSVTMDCGCKVGAAMGVNTWAVFAGTDDHAVVDGDFACLQGELQATLKTLRSNDVNIVAIHNHMEEETPRVFFLHYWGVGPATKLATAVKATLDAQKVAGKH